MEVGDFPLKDKVVVVTGGGSGINFKFCERAAKEGAKVVVADIALIPEAKELIDKSDNLIYQETDVSNWAHLHRLVDVAKDKFGSTPDVYVAGAGVFEPKWSNFWHDPEEESYKQVHINLSHPIKLSRIAMRQLASEDRKGVILPFGSVGGIAGTYNCPIYIATKHGIIGFVKSMRLLEKYEGIKVVTILPGAVDSPLWDEGKRRRTGFDTIESLKPDEVAKAMIDLVQEGKYGGGTLLEIMANGGPKTRVIPDWNIDPPQGGSLTQVKGAGDIPPAFEEMKEVMDNHRKGSANKGKPGHKKKMSISQKTPGLWLAQDED